MAQISQNADGTYTKTYSDTEIAIMQQLQIEIDNRKSADDQLYVYILDMQNRMETIEGESFSLAEMQNAITANTIRIEAAEKRISRLESSMTIDAYSKQEIDTMLIPWHVEIISKAFDTPTMQMFEEANLKEIESGFVHYPGGNITDQESLEFSPNTMRRYSISAYTSVAKEIEFAISYADRCVVVLNDEEVATYQEDGGNFNGTQKVLTLNLPAGWNRINFLVANETQQGGLVVSSTLAQSVERLSPLSKMSGKISGEQIQVGSLGEEHFSPNMDIVLKKLHATTSSEPAGVFGDPDSYGAIQIADGVISKTKGEPLTIHSDLKVVGYIRDKDGNILDGGGGGGLSTADREKLDSIEWGAEVNQNAFSYVKLVDLPADAANPFANVISSSLKMDTLRIRGDLGITYGIETVKNEAGDDVPQMVIKNSPTLFKQKLIVSVDDQDTFRIDDTDGAFQLGRGTVQVFIEGNKQSYANYYEVDEHTIRLVEKLPAGLNVLIEWQEGSPQFAKETIISLLDIPVASLTQDGLMSRFHVNDLYDHKHSVIDIPDLNTFTGIEINDGETIHKIDPVGLDKIKLLAGKNIKLEKLNDTLRISTVGPKLSAGNNIGITGSVEEGYTIINTQRLEVARGLSLDHIEGIDVISGPRFLEGKGIDIQTVDDVTYQIKNNMSLVSKGGGLYVDGNPEDGYVIGSRLEADGIAVETMERGWFITNKTRLIESGGIEITGDNNNGWKIRNDMTLQAAARGSVVVTGSAAGGYTLTGLWPSIQGSTALAVDDGGNGTYTIRNEGVTSYNGQTGTVVGVGTLNKVQKGLGIEVSFMGGGDYVVTNTGVIDLVDDGRGIDVQEQANGVWRIVNTGVIRVIQGAGISVSTDGQGNATVTNTGIHRIHPGRGIDISQSGNDVTILNDGIVELVEGEGIDINTNGSGMATVRNTGVLTVNGQSGHVTLDLDPDIPPTEMSVASVYPFYEYAEEYRAWMKTTQDSTTHYAYGVKGPEMTHFNVLVVAAVESFGQSADLTLYKGDASNVIDQAVVSTPRHSLDGESIVLSCEISHLSDYTLTGVHIGFKNVNGTAYARVQRAWLTIGQGAESDYQV